MIVLPDGGTDSPSAWEALEKLAQERSGRLAFDIGANRGQAARLLAPCFTSVVSYEPAIESYEYLMASVPANVRTDNVAMGRRVGTMRLGEASDAIGSGQLVNWAAHHGHAEWGALTGTRVVPSTTIDYEVSELGVLPALVKIDTEGWEVEVLGGARHTIALGFTSWFVEVHDAELGAKVVAAFGKRKYRTEVLEHDWLWGDERAEDHFYVVAGQV